MTNAIEKLKAERAALDQMIQKEEGKAALRTKIESLITEAGYTMDELYPPKGSATKSDKPKGTRAKPKYQNPDNKREKWAGPEVSNAPQWVVDYEAAGGNLEDLRIQGK